MQRFKTDRRDKNVPYRIFAEAFQPRLSGKPRTVGGEFHYKNFIYTTTTTTSSTTTTTNPPTAITLSSFTAKAKGGKVMLIWKTKTEIDNIGFNIYRSESENGGYVKINSDIIPAKGNSTHGAVYRFNDKNVQVGKVYWYKLEDVDSGGSTQHDPVKVEVADSKKKKK